MCKIINIMVIIANRKEGICMKEFTVLGYELNIPANLEIFNSYRNLFKKEA